MILFQDPYFHHKLNVRVLKDFTTNFSICWQLLDVPKKESPAWKAYSRHAICWYWAWTLKFHYNRMTPSAFHIQLEEKCNFVQVLAYVAFYKVKHPTNWTCYIKYHEMKSYHWQFILSLSANSHALEMSSVHKNVNLKPQGEGALGFFQFCKFGQFLVWFFQFSLTKCSFSVLVSCAVFGFSPIQSLVFGFCKRWWWFFGFFLSNACHCFSGYVKSYPSVELNLLTTGNSKGPLV